MRHVIAEQKGNNIFVFRLAQNVQVVVEASACNSISLGSSVVMINFI